MITTQLTIAQDEQLKAIDAQFGEREGFTAGFVILLEEKGISPDTSIKEIQGYLNPKRGLRMQLCGVLHNLTK